MTPLQRSSIRGVVVDAMFGCADSRDTNTKLADRAVAEIEKILTTPTAPVERFCVACNAKEGSPHDLYCERHLCRTASTLYRVPLSEYPAGMIPADWYWTAAERDKAMDWARNYKTNCAAHDAYASAQAEKKALARSIAEIEAAVQAEIARSRAKAAAKAAEDKRIIDETATLLAGVVKKRWAAQERHAAIMDRIFSDAPTPSLYTFPGIAYDAATGEYR